MKTFGGVLLVAACFVASTHSFPRTREPDSEEQTNFEVAQPSDTRNRFIRPMTFDFPDMSFDDSDEIPVKTWPSIFRLNPFDGWYERTQDAMNRLKEQMMNILSGIVDKDASSDAIPGVANSSSITKVINGHVVTINETVYADKEDEYGTWIRVRVISVDPQNETVSTTERRVESEGDQTPRSVETVEDLENNIPKNEVDTLTA
ncbi:icarapin-like [Colletes latitarsis]|uniref:icarapin-like n=1 Tax=Colletes latitarsis TaxID=2605962 RepID=UPI004036C380